MHIACSAVAHAHAKKTPVAAMMNMLEYGMLFKNIPGLVGCIAIVVKVLDVAADGLMTVVIGGDGTAKLEKKERNVKSCELRHERKHSLHIPFLTDQRPVTCHVHLLGGTPVLFQLSKTVYNRSRADH